LRPRSDASAIRSPESFVSVKSGAGSPSRTTASSSGYALGVVRVSRVHERDGERVISPTEQQERVRTACADGGLELVEVTEELEGRPSI
jgi:hypothetical protein